MYIFSLWEKSLWRKTSADQLAEYVTQIPYYVGAVLEAVMDSEAFILHFGSLKILHM